MGSGRLSGHEQTRPTPSPLRHSPLPSSAERLPALGAEFWLVVDEGLAALSVALTPGSRAAIDSHVRLLFAWNAAINLTALRTPEQVARGHVLDSLAAASTCRRLLASGDGQASGGSLLDLGSGGGFPGLPLAVTVGVGRAALVDSTNKKADFLRVAAEAAANALRAAGEVAPQLDVLAERAEDLADEPDQRAQWDVVTARAVGSLAEVVELGLPLLRVGGHVLAWKRDPVDGSLAAEIAAARRVLQAAGGGRPRVLRLEAAPATSTGSVLVIVRKVRPTPDRYPRPPAERKRAALLR